MPQKTKHVRHNHPPLTKRYIVFSHNDRDAWVHPSETFPLACSVAREMLGAGASMSVVIDTQTTRLVHDATRPFLDHAKLFAVPGFKPSSLQ